MNNILALAALLMISVVTVSLAIRMDKLEKDILNMKTKLNRISEHIGLPDPVSDELKIVLLELVSKGEAIKAVKEYRKATGASLLEAKQYVDELSNFKN
ncbi:hypothetical protein LMF32_04525 [Desemzia sp. C1]|uniref:hypothetical protein n=1 Tax=Desemzia sp. C1 TaxID=2892016 RepID=UPI001E4173BE|nr:hypothetical protein [Desemzia sp. C1]MCI3028368.1 hypothetical protein [Desemzia sp. C1]